MAKNLPSTPGVFGELMHGKGLMGFDPSALAVPTFSGFGAKPDAGPVPVEDATDDDAENEA